MILGLTDDASLDVTELFNEAFYLAQGTQIEKIKIVFEKAQTDVRQALARWSESLVIEVIESRGQGVLRKVPEVAGQSRAQSRAGIIVLPHCNLPLLRTFFGSPVTKLASTLPCPLLAAKQSDPYERLLVPFNGSLAAQRALEIAVDLSRQLEATVAVAIVVEPSYLRGASSATGQWEKEMLRQVRELARIHKVKIEEIVRRGNPVKEILSAATDCQLLVMGGVKRRSGWFSLDVTAMVLNQAPCSVLLVY